MRVMDDEWIGQLYLDSASAEDDETGAFIEWRGEYKGPDGPLHVWLSVPRSETSREPSPEQLAYLHNILQHFEEFRRSAVSYVRDDVRRDPNNYGLLDENGAAYPTYPIPWVTASLEEYLNSFRLNQIGIPSPGEVAYLAFKTELDIEHGVAVEMHGSKAEHTGMVCDYGPMLIL